MREREETCSGREETCSGREETCSGREDTEPEHVADRNRSRAGAVREDTIRTAAVPRRP